MSVIGYVYDKKTERRIENLPKKEKVYLNPQIPTNINILKRFFKKDEVCVRYLSYDEFKRKGLMLIEGKLRPSAKEMYKGQMYYYKLKYKDEPLLADEMSIEEIPRVDNKIIRIRFDRFRGEYGKGSIRLEGRGCGYAERGYKGSWKEIV